jgi:hypothetical protein
LSESWGKCLGFGAETRTISGNSSHFLGKVGTTKV